MGEIAAASEQQSLGVQQIDQSIDCMNSVTQQVAASAEESASAAEELSAQATEMQAMVRKFQLSEPGSSAGTSSRMVARLVVAGPTAQGPRPGGPHRRGGDPPRSGRGRSDDLVAWSM